MINKNTSLTGLVRAYNTCSDTNVKNKIFELVMNKARVYQHLVAVRDEQIANINRELDSALKEVREYLKF